MIFTTTFARCWAECPCPEGYRKAARGLGGIKKYGRDTETDIRDLIRVLGPSEVSWLFSEPGVFRTRPFIGHRTVGQTLGKILADTAKIAYKVPLKTADAQELLDDWIAGHIKDIGNFSRHWLNSSTLYRCDQDVVKALLIAQFNKLARE